MGEFGVGMGTAVFCYTFSSIKILQISTTNLDDFVIGNGRVFIVLNIKTGLRRYLVLVSIGENLGELRFISTVLFRVLQPCKNSSC